MRNIRAVRYSHSQRKFRYKHRNLRDNDKKKKGAWVADEQRVSEVCCQLSRYKYIYISRRDVGKTAQRAAKTRASFTNAHRGKSLAEWIIHWRVEYIAACVVPIVHGATDGAMLIMSRASHSDTIREGIWYTLVVSRYSIVIDDD